jgi:hypothetical protein
MDEGNLISSAEDFTVQTNDGVLKVNFKCVLSQLIAITDYNLYRLSMMQPSGYLVKTRYGVFLLKIEKVM